MDKDDIEQRRKRDTVEAVIRAVHIIESFSRHRPVLTVQQLVESTGLSRTTIYRLAGTLESAGWLIRQPDGSYSLGMRLFRMGTIAVSQLDIRRVARPIMEDLSNELGDSSYLFIDDKGRALCVERVIGRAPIKVTMIDVGQAMHPGSGAAYFALQAWSPSSEAQELSSADLAGRLAEVRQLGYALNLDEVAQGVSAVMVPVRDRYGVSVAALGVGGLSSRFNADHISRSVDDLKRAARRIELSLYGG